MRNFKSKEIRKAYDEFVKSMIYELSIIGNDLMAKAYENRDFSNRTFNLHDSYGYAVYFDSNQVEVGYFSKQSSELRKGLDGRTEIENFFRSYNPINKGFELVVVAAIFYAQDLEEGKTPTNTKYQVISNIYGDISNISSKIKHSKVRFIKDGEKV